MKLMSYNFNILNILLIIKKLKKIFTKQQNAKFD